MSIPTGTILRIVAEFLWDDGEINQNVFNVELTGGAGPYDDSDVVDDCLEYIEGLYDNIELYFAAEIDGNSVTVYKWDVSGQDWDEVGTTAWSVTSGGSATTGLPRGVALLMTAKSEDPDIDARKYLPGMVEGALASEIFSAPVLAAAVNFAGDWVTAIVGSTSGATITPVVWSVANLALEYLVDHYIVNGIPAYQRRRKNNVGI